jgi:hypothetical protein
VPGATKTEEPTAAPKPKPRVKVTRDERNRWAWGGAAAVFLAAIAAAGVTRLLGGARR